jgi:DNA transformation protein and related proteins
LNNKTMLRGLRNIGTTIADRLETIGLNTVGDLKRIGTAKAFKLIKGAYPDVTIPVCYYLYSLQGALEGKHWDALTANTKSRLLREAGVKRTIWRSLRRGAQRKPGLTVRQSRHNQA